MAVDQSCCVIVNGDVFIGPPMRADGSGYDDALAGGLSWSATYPSITLPRSSFGNIALPSSRPLGSVEISYTPTYRDFGRPVSYSLRQDNVCAKSRYLESLDLALQLACSNQKNNELALFGGSTTSLNVTVSNEPIAIKGFVDAGTIIPFANAPLNANEPVGLAIVDSTLNTTNYSYTVTATDTLGASASQLFTWVLNGYAGNSVPLILGVDYEYSLLGIRVLKSFTLPANRLLLASYSGLSQTQNNLFEKSCFDCSLIVEANNIVCNANSSSQSYLGSFAYFFPRVRLFPSGSNDLFQADSFRSFAMDGEALSVRIGNRSIRMLEITSGI